MCDSKESVGIYCKLGHDLVKRVDGHETVATQFQTDQLGKEIYEQIGQQVLHTGGPASQAGQAAFADLSERFAKEEILPRINEDIIGEHEDNPIGSHSDDLQRVLHHFRRQPIDGKYVVVETERSEEWAIGILSGERGEPPKMLDNRFDSVEAVTHEIFCRRVEEFRETYQET
jgi:branched-chain amino acid transport system permease protein